MREARRGRAWGWGAALAAVATSTALALALDPLVSEGDLALVYLLGVVAVAYHVPLGPSVLAALASVLALNFFFVPPRYTFAVDQAEYLLTFAVMGTVGVVTSGLAARVRQDRLDAAEREQRTASLYAFSREIASLDDDEALEAATVEHIGRLLGCDVRLDRFGADGALVRSAGYGAPLDAGQAGPHGVTAGEIVRLPLPGSTGPLGVLSIRCADPATALAAPQRETVEALLRQAALAAERLAATAARRESELVLEAERMRSSLLSTVSHDLRTPLSTILLATSTLLDSAVPLRPVARDELLRNAHREAERLHELVQKLLEMTRVSGAVRLRLDWHVPDDVVGSALTRAGAAFDHDEVRVVCGVPLAWFDETLVELALVNLVENAARYGGPPIEIDVQADGEAVRFSVRDHGPGVAAQDPAALFDRFVRGDNASGVQGSGLGLAIVRAVAEAHGGTAAVEPLERGVRFSIRLPQPSAAPTVPLDPEDPVRIPEEPDQASLSR